MIHILNDHQQEITSSKSSNSDWTREILLETAILTNSNPCWKWKFPIHLLELPIHIISYDPVIPLFRIPLKGKQPNRPKATEILPESHAQIESLRSLPPFFHGRLMLTFHGVFYKDGKWFKWQTRVFVDGIFVDGKYITGVYKYGKCGSIHMAIHTWIHHG